MKNNKNILLLLTPSWVVHVIAGTLSLLAVAGTIVLSRYQGSQLRQEIFEAQSSASATTTSSAYQNITDNITNNHVLSVAPLFLLWACVGLLVYFFAISIAKSFGEIVELHDELDYVHVSRQALIRQALLELGIRLLAVIGWFVFIKLSIDIFIPYALAAANIAALSFTLTNALFVLLAITVIYIDVCIHAVFLRLIALKPRLFGV